MTAIRPPSLGSPDVATLNDLRRRVDELTRERDQLLIVVDLLQELSAVSAISDVLQRVARRLGEIFGLDRASIYLAGDGLHEVRLMATFEDPTLRNVVVDLERYPELGRALASGKTVFIADVAKEPMPAEARSALQARRVTSIVVAPIKWRQSTIGAIFLRTDRESAPFNERDLKFCEVIANLTGRALRNANLSEEREQKTDEREARRQRADRERIAFVAFLRRLLQRYATTNDQLWAETLLPRESDEELERLVSVAMQVVVEEARG
jgi:GAF domain-containing protein